MIGRLRVGQQHHRREATAAMKLAMTALAMKLAMTALAMRLALTAQVRLVGCLDGSLSGLVKERISQNC